MTDLHTPLDADVRRAEPDLWLSSRLVADPTARATLMALYALHVELGKVGGAVNNALAGEIRLAWWREEAEAMAIARVPGHPALQRLKAASNLDPALLDAMIDARHAELGERPFADEPALLTYLDGVDGGLMRAAAGLLSPGAAPGPQIARAWGWSRLWRERAAWKAKGRDWAPASWGEASETEIAAYVRHRVADALKTARNQAAALPVAAFPAIAYAALAPLYGQGRTPSELEKRARLIWASLRGRV